MVKFEMDKEVLTYVSLAKSSVFQAVSGLELVMISTAYEFQFSVVQDLLHVSNKLACGKK